VMGLTPTIAEPKTPVARNITSFGPSLKCMDNLLLQAHRPRTRITSTQLPDRTKKVAVGANDMLINAVNQMNRRSNAFIFIDQGITKSSTGHLLEIEVPDSKAKVQPLKPQFYIRGSISQLDTDVHKSQANVGIEVADEDLRIEDGSGLFQGGRSIVTVDLHLVAFPSRQILPGASVSNSMVVTKKRFGSEFSGDVAKLGIGVLFQIDNMESTGQAVRNLIELGLIELLGQHSNVPYWECLSLDSTNAQKSAIKEHVHVSEDNRVHIKEAQTLLIQIRRLSGTPTGKMDAETTRALAVFQKDVGLIANGKPNFDTMRALRAATPKQTQKTPKSVPNDTGDFRSINVFLKTKS